MSQLYLVHCVLIWFCCCFCGLFCICSTFLCVNTLVHVLLICIFFATCVLLIVLNSLSHRIILVSVIGSYLHSVPVFHHFRPTGSNQTRPFAVILLFIVQVALKCSSPAITYSPKINPNHPKCVLLGVKKLDPTAQNS